MTETGAGVPAGNEQPGIWRQNSVYRRTMAACDKVAAAAVQGADAAGLTKIFAEASGRTVILLDADLRLQAQAGSGTASGTGTWDPGDVNTAGLLHALGRKRGTLRTPSVPGSPLAHGCLATPVMVGDILLGYLLMESADAADDADLIVASYAATLFALALTRAQTGRELGQRYREAIVDSLVSGHFLDTVDAQRKAGILGLTDSRPFRVAVAREGAPEAPRRAGGELAAGLLARVSSSVPFPAVIRGPELVMLLPDQDQARTAPAGADTSQVLSAIPRGGRVTCGISELTRLPEDAPRALLQAQQAIDLGIRIGRGGETVRYEELGVYRLLLQIGDMNRLLQYAGDVLGPLIEYDTRHKSDLLGTLSVYLNQHESPKETARVLRVHVTVSYRIQRIESLTSLDLANPDHRLSAHVAVKIIESQRSGLAK